MKDTVNKYKMNKRKEYIMFRGLLSYFPDALMEVSHVSYVGNKQHNEGDDIRWAKEKSTDHEDALLRHLKDHATGEHYDDDGLLHLSKVAWRSLAALQIYIETYGKKI